MKNSIPGYFGITILFLVLFILSCSEKPEKLQKRKMLEIQAEKKEQRRLEIIQNQDFRLWHTIDQFELSSFEHYGDFYDDRLQFYYSNNPGLKIGPATVNLMMLYFLDDRLVKIRYHLDDDISNYLLDSLGIGKLVTKYTKGKDVLATDQSIKKLRDFYIEKSLSDEFNIFWDRYIIETFYQVDFRAINEFSFDSVSSKYVYVDQLKSYSRKLMEIENRKTMGILDPNSI